MIYTLNECKGGAVMKETFGSFIRNKRMGVTPKITLKSMAEQLDLNLTLLSDIENDRKKPFPAEKIELFCEIMNLSDTEKAKMYDMAAKYSDTVSEDIVHTIMEDTESGKYARIALRMTKNGKISEKQWKAFVENAEDNS